MAVSIFLNFPGNCREVIGFYQKVFKLPEPNIMTYGMVPPGEGFQPNEKQRDLVMYSDIDVQGTLLRFSDVPEGMGTEVNMGNNISIYVGNRDEEEVARLYNELKEGGEVLIELGPTFWTKSYGFVTDKFGIQWMLGLDSD